MSERNGALPSESDLWAQCTRFLEVELEAHALFKRLTDRIPVHFVLDEVLPQAFRTEVRYRPVEIPPLPATGYRPYRVGLSAVYYETAARLIVKPQLHVGPSGLDILDLSNDETLTRPGLVIDNKGNAIECVSKADALMDQPIATKLAQQGRYVEQLHQASHVWGVTTN